MAPKTTHKNPKLCKNLQYVLWKDIREDFIRVNPKLAKIIDAINPGDDLPLIKKTYAFGDKILANGKLCFLDELKSPNIVESLSYSPVPFGMFLNKSCETFIEVQDRIIPLFVLRAGYTIGLFETLDLICGASSTPIWNVNAGSRSTFMLAKINNNLWHKRLVRHFNITTPAPTNLSDHWHVFADIVNSEVAQCDWHCDVVFFPKCWIKHLSDKSAGWTQLREYLFRECWLQASPMIGKSFSFILQQFSLSTIRRNYKPRIYITDTIRHLMSIVSGLAPAFVPANNEESAPIKIIKDAYHQIYNLPYAPVIIEPTFINQDAPYVYYSLGYPTLLEGHPEVSNINNTISDLKEIKLLIENMHRYCQQGAGEMQKFASVLQKVNFNYFHKARDNQNEINETARITDIDKNFYTNPAEFANKKFCANAPFFNGCVQIKNPLLNNNL